MNRPTKAGEIARWVAGLAYDDIPPTVLEKAKYQALSVLAAIFPGSRSPAGRRLFSVIGNQVPPGPCTIVPHGRPAPPEAAVLAHAAFSIAHDFDDYLFMGHPCHSAVSVPLALCQEGRRSGRDFLLAQVIANEVEGRLGAAVLLGPQNGQTWSFIHALGSACAAARLMDLDPDRIEQAVGIALYQPPYVLVPGFMGPDTKLLTAGVPAAAGLLAARLADGGFTGAPDILEAPQGFLRHFSYLPLRSMLSGWGRSWVMESICFKPYPGCAYIDSTIDALLHVMEEYRRRHRRALVPADVAAIRVRSTLLTVGMDGLSRGWMREEPLTPVLVNFSIPLSAAVTVLAGRLTTREMDQGFLDARREDILDLARKVSLGLDWAMSLRVHEALRTAGVLGVMGRDLTVRGILRAGRNLRRGTGGALRLGAGDYLGLGAAIFRVGARGLRGVLSRPFGRPGRARAAPVDLGDVDFTRVRFPFSSEVTLETMAGETIVFAQDLPAGTQGRPPEEIREVVRTKFLREAGEALGPRTREVMDMVLGLETVKDISSLASACCP